jgi:hypothetical protein
MRECATGPWPEAPILQTGSDVRRVFSGANPVANAVDRRAISGAKPIRSLEGRVDGGVGDLSGSPW